ALPTRNDAPTTEHDAFAREKQDPSTRQGEEPASDTTKSMCRPTVTLDLPRLLQRKKHEANPTAALQGAVGPEPERPSAVADGAFTCDGKPCGVASARPRGSGSGPARRRSRRSQARTRRPFRRRSRERM